MKSLFLQAFIILWLVVAGSCGSKQQAKKGGLQGEISVSGAFALYPLAVKWAEEFQNLHPGVRIDVSAGGAGKGMTDVLANAVDLGMVSREIYPPEIDKGAVAFAVAKDAVVATVNVQNPDREDLLKTGLTRDAAIKLWITSEYKTWGQVAGSASTNAVHVYTRSDACGAAETWALWMDKKQEDLVGTGVFGDPGLATAIQKDVLGIGLNNIGYVYDETSRKPNPGMIPLPIDVNNNGILDPEELFYDTKDSFIKAIGEDRYPSPPARDLYLVSKGIPVKPEVIEFVRYILSDGQKHNIPTGYISLPEEKLHRGLVKLGTEKQ
ncbi:MAG: PstS family phosphate ABC transporter substrate-binding protein [Prevotellaceae bacterium]|jgi:phosphate transport system substrate-binding protein|nr:PstS family phosphate ABC transporter substrate-binding protein [Prevotellaceae bacterium]